DDLERAIRRIARRPSPELERRPAPVRADRVTRTDAVIRAAVIRGRGRGRRVALPPGMASVPEQLPVGRAAHTLDTPEHRWIAAQVAAILRRLAALRAAVLRAGSRDGPGARRRQIADDLAGFEARIAALARLDPLAAASGPAPPGFASLKLLS